ncbi:MAG: Gfo/Idh/MocA family oxidoreductase [Deltaproteobacteria bacterium]|nr:Gfo/Idh/MocA family oxidoreductase [Deltaproteobacteria bacterium]
MEQVRIGLIGAGLIGGTHSLMLRQIADRLGGQVELVAVADPVAAQRALFQERYGYRHAFANAAELLQADLNTVFICTPTKFHAELVQAAAERKLQLFCEKPLAMSYAEAAALHAAVQRAGITAQIGLVLRFSAVYRVMQAVLAQPEMGTPVAVMFRDDQCFPIRGGHNTAWRKDRQLSAGGTLIEHGVHDLDLLTVLFGPVARVRAWQHNRAGHPGIEDFMAVELEFDCGLRAQLLNLWHDMVQRNSNRRLEIFCQQGFVASDYDMIGDIVVQVGDGDELRLGPDEVLRRFESLLGVRDHGFRDWYGIPYLLQDLCFIEALLAGRPASPDLGAGVEAQRLAAAVYEAARTGEEIDVRSWR